MIYKYIFDHSSYEITSGENVVRIYCVFQPFQDLYSCIADTSRQEFLS